MPRPLAMLSLTLAMAMTGANVPLGKAITAEIPVEILMLYRFALAALLLAILARWEPGPPMATLSVRQWGAVWTLGLVGSVLFTFLVFKGAALTTGTNAGIITSAVPAVVAAMAAALGERLRRGELAMIGLAVAGIALIQTQTGAGPAGANPWLGNVLVALAVVCEATAILVARGMSVVLRPVRLALAVTLTGLLCSVPFALPHLGAFDPSRIGLGVWLVALWYAITSSILCTVLWFRAAPYVESWAAGLASAAVPVVAVAVSALYLGEAIGPVQLAGAAMSIAAIAVGTLSRR